MDADPQLHTLVSEEMSRQRQTLEMIASENFAPVSVLQAQGSILTNKYSEDIRAVATMADVPISMRLNVSRLIGLGSCSRPTTQMCSRTLELRRTPLRSAP